jgi:hypothetical protein
MEMSLSREIEAIILAAGDIIIFRGVTHFPQERNLCSHPRHPIPPLLPKRQRAGALQDASRHPGIIVNAPASWTAVALPPPFFIPRHAKTSVVFILPIRPQAAFEYAFARLKTNLDTKNSKKP